MPGSILINDGRRSASPDRRVTFGNIERYDIMTSNEIKNSMFQRRSSKDNVQTVNGNYPMTRLDNRIRKAVMLGFTYMPGDSVTYGEIVDFLMEFNVIVNVKLCNERQVTAIMQSSYPKCVVKASVKHSLVFQNIENRSDEVIKEELVRVTTEPIINPYNDTASIEAKEWIQEEPEREDSDDDNEELLQIEKAKEIKEKENKNFEKDLQSSPRNLIIGTPPFTEHDNHSINEISSNKESLTTRRPLSFELSATIRDMIDATTRDSTHIGVQNNPPPIRERAIDVPDHATQKKCEKENNVSRMLVSKDDTQINVKRTSSFSNNSMARSRSVSDMAKRFEHSTHDGFEKTTNIQRKRSFTRSTDRSFVGSIRERFRAKSKYSTDVDNENANDPIETNPKNVKNVSKKTKNELKKTDNKMSNKMSSAPTTPDSTRKIKVIESTANAIPKSSSVNQVRSRTNSARKINEFGGSVVDVRSSFRSKPISEDRGIHRSTSTSSDDIRSSFRTNSGMNSLKHHMGRTPVRTIIDDRNTIVKSAYTQRSTTPKSHISPVEPSSNNQTTRSSFRESGSKLRVDVARKEARNTYLTSNVKNTRGSIRDKKTTTTPLVKRTDSRKASKNSSEQSSASSTPSISRENSKTNLTIQTPSRLASSQQKDLARIAKAFQKATNEIYIANDNIEKFMIGVATDDLEVAINERLKLDDLYDHIRHRMIISKDYIFEGRRSDVTLEMSQYFDFLFKTLAANFDQIGCELVTNKSTGEKICYLIHVKLVDYVDDLSEMSAASVENDVISSYV